MHKFQIPWNFWADRKGLQALRFLGPIVMFFLWSGAVAGFLPGLVNYSPTTQSMLEITNKRKWLEKYKQPGLLENG